jgi:hypothetical protein
MEGLILINFTTALRPPKARKVPWKLMVFLGTLTGSRAAYNVLFRPSTVSKASDPVTGPSIDNAELRQDYYLQDFRRV